MMIRSDGGSLAAQRLGAWAVVVSLGAAALATVGCVTTSGSGGGPAAVARVAPGEPSSAETQDAAGGLDMITGKALRAEVARGGREGGVRVTLVNAWATWCEPCKRELPQLADLKRRWGEKGFRLMLVAVDAPDRVPAVKAFLAEHDVSFRTWMARDDDEQFISALHPDWSGALPANMLFVGEGESVALWEGDLPVEVLEGAVMEYLRNKED